MIIDILLLLFLVICAIVAVEMMDLLSATIIMGAYSLIMAMVWTRLNAVDVAFTEATVGAGITTVFVLAAISRTKRGEADMRDITVDNNLRSEAGKVAKKHNITSLLVVILTGAVLIYGTVDMPDFGDPKAPAHNHVAPYMLEHGEHDTVSKNIVTSVLASYRGFDTLGEVTVVLTAVLGVILILGRRTKRKEKVEKKKRKSNRTDDQVTIRTVCRIMVPFIQLFGFYVIAHGDLGPGGGFQGGVILASSIILLTIVLGNEEGRKRISEKVSTLLAPTGVLIYAGIGILCIIFGGAYLEYSKLPLGSEHLAIHLGIYGIEIGVGITVAVSMVAIFFGMADKRND